MNLFSFLRTRTVEAVARAGRVGAALRHRGRQKRCTTGAGMVLVMAGVLGFVLCAWRQEHWAPAGLFLFSVFGVMGWRIAQRWRRDLAAARAAAPGDPRFQQEVRAIEAWRARMLAEETAEELQHLLPAATAAARRRL